jgi:hypothetical protein
LIPAILQQCEGVPQLPWCDRKIFQEREVRVDYEKYIPLLEERIIADVFLWIDTCVNKGAKQFILNTQSTNLPQPDKLKTILVSKYPQLIYVEKDMGRGIGKSSFSEYWFVIQNKDI